MNRAYAKGELGFSESDSYKAKTGIKETVVQDIAYNAN